MITGMVIVITVTVAQGKYSGANDCSNPSLVSNIDANSLLCNSKSRNNNQNISNANGDTTL